MLDDGTCDRCKKWIPDFKLRRDGGMTAGYYLAGAWLRYVNPGEQVICHTCMWADPRYIADYGRHAGS